VEHVMAALYGLQIDNCKIELSEREPPVCDGSSIEYVKVLLKAGIEEQERQKEFFVINETIRYTNEKNGVDIVALPTDDYRITVMIDYNNPALGSQHTGLFNLEKEFVTEFASARTFCFLSEVEMLYSQGLIKGGSLDSAIVIVDKDFDENKLKELQETFSMKNTPVLGTTGVLNDSALRYKNEPARHKLLDLLGDLSLAGVPLKAQILAARPGHASNIEFAKKIRALFKKKSPLKRFQIDKNSESVLNINDLLKIMPHRYPFLLIDKVIDVDYEEQTILGVKNVTINEEFFNGHFPGKPVMPGVLICEAMAQTGCLLLLQSLDDYSQYHVFFMSIKNVKFRKPVIPGDQLVMDLQMLGKKFNSYMFKGTTYVNSQVVAEAEFSAAVIKKEL
ncbi:MAG TPA: bifunctional UDP-3-O-[3-hydroxymyristoyl] N-acetylglucosamine deacetylase/3-hydroxyacyl-ACP dehydratase, partial [Candidatus Kapabacteria bacterium]|nr:bifunctional UDP-3-O-[3-hydroxymyristoyl] N-acetylglucosamine deacetylase/3-hydroxyacyl-ACP dehydratase [Candidatus Kapabacteria bacterium]